MAQANEVHEKDMELPLGKITITEPGKPVRATANLANPSEPLYVHAYAILRLESDTGKIYIQTTPDDDRSTLRYNLSVLTAKNPSFSAGITIQSNGSNIANIWIDADDPGDSVVIAALVA